jgi:hypothetical protein
VSAALCALAVAGLVAGTVPAAADDQTSTQPSSAPAEQPVGQPADQAQPPSDAAGLLPQVPSGKGGGKNAGAQGDGVGPQQAGGGMLPGERPTDGEGDSSAYTDAAPPLEPGFVDDYTRMWKAVDQGQRRVQRLKADRVDAATALAAASSDLALTLRVRNAADFAYDDASAQFDAAVKNAYITGTSDVDVILGVLGSEPDDVLRNIDSFIYLRSATGSEAQTAEVARSASASADLAAAVNQSRADEARALRDRAVKELASTRAQLKRDRKELQRLVSVAAPQTVVGGNGCPKAVLDGTVPEGVNIKQLCNVAVRTAATPQAAFAIKWALVRLGAPYACEGIGRLEPWRYDCSSYVSRAYAEGAGLNTAGDGWAPSTRNMVPWDGAALDPHYAVIPANKLRPGDLALYDTCPAGEVCPYRHVVMYLGPAEPGGVPLMAHTNACGDVAHIEPFTGTDVANFLGARRVIPANGEKVVATKGALDVPAPGDKPKAGKSKPGKSKKGTKDKKGGSAG